MKALLISDIHSNIVALEAIWAREHDADAIYCAGDPDQEAHYMVIEYGQVTLRSVPYDAQVVYREVIQQPLIEEELRVTRWFFGARDSSARGGRTA